jgi:hypothetical protein
LAMAISRVILDVTSFPMQQPGAENIQSDTT